MNRGFLLAGGVLLGIGATTILILSFLLIQEKEEKHVIAEENHELKNRLVKETNNKQIIEISPAKMKTISGFARPLTQA